MVVMGFTGEDTMRTFLHFRMPTSPHSRQQRGSTIVEFSLVAAVFFSVFFTIVDLSVYNYVKLTMQNAVREGARYAVTGRSDLDPDGTGNRVAAVTAMISNASNGYLDKVMNEHDGIRVEDIDGNSISGFGGAGEIIAIHLDCQWSAFSPLIYPFLDGGKYSFTVSTAMKNESF